MENLDHIFKQAKLMLEATFESVLDVNEGLIASLRVYDPTKPRSSTIPGCAALRDTIYKQIEKLNSKKLKYITDKTKGDDALYIYYILSIWDDQIWHVFFTWQEVRRHRLSVSNPDLLPYIRRHLPKIKRHFIRQIYRVYNNDPLSSIWMARSIKALKHQKSNVRTRSQARKMRNHNNKRSKAISIVQKAGFLPNSHR